jgi:thiol-disulfide isomerase/thioredoxin
MIKALVFCLVTIISITGLSQPPKGGTTANQRLARSGGFSITGQVSGFPDSTLLYLDSIADNTPGHMDSSFVIDGRFYFKGVLASGVRQVIIHTKDFSDYKFLWLENAPVIFTAEKLKFRQAIIRGSGTQDEQQRLDVSVTSFKDERSADMEFIRTHPNSMVSASVLNVYASSWGRDTAALYYHLLSDKMKKTSYGKNVLEFITLNKDVKVGGRYVDFTQPDTAGRDVSVSDLICRSAAAGTHMTRQVRCSKVLLLEFWGTWCGPCRQGNPELIKIYQEFRDKGFEILGVAADDQKAYWKAAIRQDSLPWTNVCDLKGPRNQAVLMYGINKFPSSYLIDGDGIIIAQDLRGEALRSKLKEILK